MENLADLERKYEELGKEIERLKEQQNTGKVRIGEKYYYLDTEGCLDWSYEDRDNLDNERFNFGNYFKTEEEAEKVAEKIKIYTELKRLAERLNNGRKIDWDNDSQAKHYIEYYHTSGYVRSEVGYSYQKQGTIYCLDMQFRNIAIKEIGEDRLKKLFE